MTNIKPTPKRKKDWHNKDKEWIEKNINSLENVTYKKDFESE